MRGHNHKKNPLLKNAPKALYQKACALRYTRTEQMDTMRFDLTHYTRLHVRHQSGTRALLRPSQVQAAHRADPIIAIDRVVIHSGDPERDARLSAFLAHVLFDAGSRQVH